MKVRPKWIYVLKYVDFSHITFFFRFYLPAITRLLYVVDDMNSCVITEYDGES